MVVMITSPPGRFTTKELATSSFQAKHWQGHSSHQKEQLQRQVAFLPATPCITRSINVCRQMPHFEQHTEYSVC